MFWSTYNAGTFFIFIINERFIEIPWKHQHRVAVSSKDLLNILNFIGGIFLSKYGIFICNILDSVRSKANLNTANMSSLTTPKQIQSCIGCDSTTVSTISYSPKSNFKPRLPLSNAPEEFMRTLKRIISDR